MRKSAVLFSLMAFAAASQALAQEVPYSRTLDEQLARIKQGKPPVPQAQETAGEAMPAPAPAAAAPAEPERKAFPQQADAAPQAGGDETAMPAGTTFRDRHGDLVDSTGGGAIPALPLEVMNAGGVHYITGGIGDEELAQLKSVEGDFNLQALIASTAGEYMGGLHVRVLGEDGQQILQADDAGPYFYAALPAGHYTIEVTNREGVAKAGQVNVPAKGLVKPVLRF